MPRWYVVPFRIPVLHPQVAAVGKSNSAAPSLMPGSPFGSPLPSLSARMFFFSCLHRSSYSEPGKPIAMNCKMEKTERVRVTQVTSFQSSNSTKTQRSCAERTAIVLYCWFFFLWIPLKGSGDVGMVYRKYNTQKHLYPLYISGSRDL